MRFLILLVVWLIVRVILHIFTTQDKNFGEKFYKGLYLSILVDLIFFFVIFYWYLKIRLFFSYLISINLVTLFYYGLDKFFAQRKLFRIPEKLLLFLSLVGGTLGALLGMFLFRHKTKKASFQLWFWIVVVVQIVIVYIIYRYVLR